MLYGFASFDLNPALPFPKSNGLQLHLQLLPPFKGQKENAIQNSKFKKKGNASSGEYLRQFDNSTCHPYNFGKTRKIGLQQFGKSTWQK
jgi:hypothetical protein